MASNLSTIGFVFSDAETFRDVMMKCASQSTVQLDCPAGAYGIWRSRSGAEVWFHLGKSDDGTTEIFGLTPFFEGQSDVLLNITAALSRDGDNAFEGAMQGWVSPDGVDDGSYPILFDAVDFAAHTALEWPAKRRVRLTAFARELEAFASDADYYAARGSAGDNVPQLAAHAYIPVGLFAAEDANAADAATDATTVQSAAVLTGRVLEHRAFTNEVSGQDFVWLLVESLEATFDIVADPAVVSGAITDGGTIEAAVVMFGRLLEDDDHAEDDSDVDDATA